MGLGLPSIHNSLACLWPQLRLHGQPPDDGPHQGEIKEVHEEADAELQEIHEDTETDGREIIIKKFESSDDSEE